jgi:hypothetical protein
MLWMYMRENHITQFKQVMIMFILVDRSFQFWQPMTHLASPRCERLS